MSEIPFVKLLGDELERAAKRTERRPSRRRRLGLFALAGALLASGTALATGLLSGDVERQAFASIACYDGAGADFSRSVAVVPPEAGSADASPVALCRRELRWPAQSVRPLVACGMPAGVAVIPGRHTSDCVAAGFTRLDQSYGRARIRVAELERRILAIETSTDCIPPDELARAVQRLLDRGRWTGWRTEVRSDLGGGPCGSVSQLGGDGRRYISGALASDDEMIFVFRGASRRTTDLLYSAERSLLAPLFEESGATCFSFDRLRERAERVFGATGLGVTARRTTVPSGTELDDSDGRWTRYKDGCAVLAGGRPGRERDTVVIEIFVSS